MRHSNIFDIRNGPEVIDQRADSASPMQNHTILKLRKN